MARKHKGIQIQEDTPGDLTITCEYCGSPITVDSDFGMDCVNECGRKHFEKDTGAQLGMQLMRNLGTMFQGGGGVTVEQAIQRLSDALTTASEGPSALLELDALWDKLGVLEAKAESRMRLELPKAEPLELGLEPQWLTEQLYKAAAPEKHGDSLRYDTCMACKKLMRAVLATGTECKAEINKAPLGALEVQWDTDNALTWLVGRPTLSWPGVNVRVYWRNDASEPKMEARTFHLAHGVIEHAKIHLLPKSE